MLREAAASVAAQNWPEVEQIVADGGSDDGTREMLAEFAFAQFLAGPDQGIYHGLNRALAQARGDIVGWLNSDDLYAPGAFEAAAAAFDADANLAAVCGGAQIETGDAPERRYAPDLVADLSPGALLVGPTLPNAWFFRREVLEKVGAFALDLGVAADSDFMLRFARLGLPHSAAQAQFYRYRRHAGSATLSTEGASRRLREDMLRLAQKWRDDPDAEVRRAARAVEGRCRAALCASALGRGDIGAVAAQAAHAPLIAAGVSDFAGRTLIPRLRRRRYGESR